MSARVRVVGVHLDVVHAYVARSKRLRAFQQAFMDAAMKGAKATYVAAELGHSTPPIRYVRSFHVIPGMVTRLENWAPTATMVEFGSHARGIVKVLGYGPMRNGVDTAIVKWRGRRVRI